VFAIAMLVAATVLGDIDAVRAVAPNSDAASQVLEGLSVAHGNVLLHGWALSLDSFWTTEVPFYALAVAILGVHGFLLDVIPAVIAALVACFGVLIAADGRSRGAAVVGGCTVVAFLVLPVDALARFFFAGGFHVGAILLSLIAFFALRRGRWGIGVVVATIALTLGLLGDFQTVAYGVGPIGVAAVVAMLRRRSVRAGLPALVSAIGACVAYEIVRQAAVAIGTFSIGSANPFASASQAWHNVRNLYAYGGELIGLNSTIYGTGGMPGWLQDVRVVGAVVVIVASVLTLVRLVIGAVAGTAATDEGTSSWWASQDPGWHLDDMLLLGAIGVAASYVALAFFTWPTFGRYLFGAAIYLSILAGRVVARAWESRRIHAARPILAGLGAVLFLLFAAGFAYTATAPRQPQPSAILGDWLVARGLTNGVGAYWSASITTVESNDKVRIRPVLEHGNRLVRYDRESDAAWYAGQHFSFVVFQPGAAWGGVGLATATATFGRPAHAYGVDGYEVLVWRRPFTVSPENGAGA
jgi:hypothetical protein